MKREELSAQHCQNCQKDEKEAAVGPWAGETSTNSETGGQREALFTS